MVSELYWPSIEVAAIATTHACNASTVAWYLSLESSSSLFGSNVFASCFYLSNAFFPPFSKSLQCVVEVSQFVNQPNLQVEVEAAVVAVTSAVALVAEPADPAFWA